MSEPFYGEILWRCRKCYEEHIVNNVLAGEPNMVQCVVCGFTEYGIADRETVMPKGYFEENPTVNAVFDDDGPQPYQQTQQEPVTMYGWGLIPMLMIIFFAYAIFVGF